METINKKAEELFKRKDVKDTPFIIITDVEKKESYAVMGKWRVTEKYTDPRKAEAEVKRITWNRLIQVVTILIENKEK